MSTAILLIAHGSRHADANADLNYVESCLRGARGETIVVASFLELAEPGIIDGGRMCVRAGAQRVVLMPYFLSAGIHVRRDLTEARQRLREEHPEVDFVLAEPLSRHPLLVEVVAQRISESLGKNPLTPQPPLPRGERGGQTGGEGSQSALAPPSPQGGRGGLGG